MRAWLMRVGKLIDVCVLSNLGTSMCVGQMMHTHARRYTESRSGDLRKKMDALEWVYQQTERRTDKEQNEYEQHGKRYRDYLIC